MQPKVDETPIPKVCLSAMLFLSCMIIHSLNKVFYADFVLITLSKDIKNIYCFIRRMQLWLYCNCNISCSFTWRTASVWSCGDEDHKRDGVPDPSGVCAQDRIHWSNSVWVTMVLQPATDWGHLFQFEFRMELWCGETKIITFDAWWFGVILNIYKKEREKR